MDYLFKALQSAIESAAEQRAGGAPPQQQAQQKPPRTKHVRPTPAPEPPGQPHIAPPPPEADGGLVPLFEDGKSLIRALVASEVLGPPIALREPSTWSQRPNEPSI